MLVFPHRDSLREWVDLVRRKGNGLSAYLPHIDDVWFDDMFSCVELTKLVPQCQDDVSCAAAKLFYKINKRHHRVDGNKRSALLVTILFFVVNDRFVNIHHTIMYRIATRVADDLRKQETVEAELENVFREHLKRLPEDPPFSF